MAALGQTTVETSAGRPMTAAASAAGPTKAHTDFVVEQQVAVVRTGRRDEVAGEEPMAGVRTSPRVLAEAGPALLAAV